MNDTRKKKDGFDKLFDEIIGDDPKKLQSYRNTKLNVEIAGQIYNLRTKNGLTQKQLAEMIGTRDTVISRLENADYDGHTIKMLQRIATALNNRLEVKFVRIKQPKSMNPSSIKHRKLAKQSA
jgi:ribosome-binding protein aMBF1 (putative translation factor)